MSARYDAIVLLGVALGAHDQPTEELRARVRSAAQAYRRFGPLPIVASGGYTGDHRESEASVMARLLREEGITGVALEESSRSTMENFTCTAQLLGGARGQRVLVVTSDYHMLRARLTARRVGFRTGGVAARLCHDAAWKALRAKEWGYLVDLLMGWQDEGKARPEWTYRLFDAVFGEK